MPSSLRRRPFEQPSDVGFSFVGRYQACGTVARRAQLLDREAVARAAGRLAGAAQQRHIDHRGDADERENADPEPQSATIPTVIGELESLTARARALAGRGERAILGIAGAPGGGKSTLAAALVAELGEAAVLVPMDGFHLAQAELVRQGIRDRMGAPHTFDVARLRGAAAAAAGRGRDGLRARVPARDRGADRRRDRRAARGPARRHRGQLPAAVGRGPRAARRGLVRRDGGGHAARVADRPPRRVRQDAGGGRGVGHALRPAQRRGRGRDPRVAPT